MSARHRVDAVAVRVCRAARDLASDIAPGRPTWIAIERLHERLRLEGGAADSLSTVEAAVAFAGAKGWLSIGPGGADSVLLRGSAP